MYPIKPVPLTFEINEGKIVERRADGTAFFGSDQYTIEYAIFASQVSGSRIQWFVRQQPSKVLPTPFLQIYQLRGILGPSYHDKHGRCG